jgi:glycosyltransferase involved in cell wall biosynthesis
MSTSLRYAVVTPARDEAANLPRLTRSLASQTIRPAEWVVVDNGSTDGTAEVVLHLRHRHKWIRLLAIPGTEPPRRGADAVRAFSAGLASLIGDPEIVVNVDADVSFEPDYFERLLEEFDRDASLGIASGTCWELKGDTWKPQHVTRGHARGAARAYRRACLEDVLPLVESVAWDGIDELRAQTRGWRTSNLPLPILHHRALGERQTGFAQWRDEGEMTQFMGYRPSYLLARTVYQSFRDPTAVAMVYGHLRAWWREKPRYGDPVVVELLRKEQSLRRLPRRIREALGRSSDQARRARRVCARTEVIDPARATRPRL